MQKRWHKGMASAVVALLLLSGCSQSKTPMQGPSEAPSKSGQSAEKGPTSPSQSQDPNQDTQNKELKIKAYYSDEQMEKLVEKEVTIRFKQESDKYKEALKTLTVSTDAKIFPLFKGFTFKTVELKNGQLTIDLSMKPESRLGSGGEAMLLDALQRTLFQFNEIQTIEVLVDGAKVESLMGHMELTHPIKRS